MLALAIASAVIGGLTLGWRVTNRRIDRREAMERGASDVRCEMTPESHPRLTSLDERDTVYRIVHRRRIRRRRGTWQLLPSMDRVTLDNLPSSASHVDYRARRKPAVISRVDLARLRGLTGTDPVDHAVRHRASVRILGHRR